MLLYYLSINIFSILFYSITYAPNCTSFGLHQYKNMHLGYLKNIFVETTKNTLFHPNQTQKGGQFSILRGWPNRRALTSLKGILTGCLKTFLIIFWTVQEDFMLLNSHNITYFQKSKKWKGVFKRSFLTVKVRLVATIKTQKCRLSSHKFDINFREPGYP